MGFRVGSYATIWSVEPTRGNSTKVRLSTSRKNRQTGQYEQDFSGYVFFCGSAGAEALRLHERDRIKLGDVDVTSRFDKEANREYVSYFAYSFEKVDANNPQQQQPVESNTVESDEDEPSPF